MFAEKTLQQISSTGTGTYQLSATAVGAFKSWVSQVASGATVFYVAENSDGTIWEVGYGVFTDAATDTITRNLILSSTGSLIDWQLADQPVYIFSVPAAAAMAFLAGGRRAAARPAWLQRGTWYKTDHPASGIDTEYWFDGTDDIVIGSVNAAANKYIPDAAAINFPAGHITGTYANAAGDATNDIDIGAGSAADSTGVYPLTWSAMTKRLDAAWAVGSGNGGLDTGSIANADYYIHIIARSDTGVVDALFSLSPTAPTMPAEYDYFRPFGWIRRSGGAIVAFKTYETVGGLDYHWGTGITDMNSVTFTSNSNDNLRTVSVPVGIQVIWNAAITGTSGNAWGFNVKTPGQTANKVAFMCQASTSLPSAMQAKVLTNTSAQVAFDVSTTAGGVGIVGAVTYGFTWSRR